jgi:hypothetical protein
MPLRKETKRRERERLANEIDSFGIIMLSPYTRYAKDKKKCVQSTRSRSYSHCKRLGVRCNAVPPTPNEWDNLKAEEARIERELAESRLAQDTAFAARAVAAEAQAAADEAARAALARQRRLEKQRSSLREKGGEMLSRGLSSLDELEALEALEAAGVAGPSLVASPPVDPSSPSIPQVPDLSSSWSPLSPSQLGWELLASPDESGSQLPS